MDIKVKTEKDELIDIEVQINDVDDYRKRSLYYWSKLYGETIKKGKDYYNLKKSIVINIMDFNVIYENDKYHNVFVIKEREDHTLFLEDLEIHYIELKKFNEKKNIDELNDLEEWTTFLKECNENYDEKIIEKLSHRKEEIGVAVELMKALSASELEYQQYLAREKYLLDEKSKKAYAEYKMKLAKKAEEEARKAEEEARNAEKKARKSEEEAIKRAKKAEDKLKKELLKVEKEKELIAVNLLDILDDELIAVKTGLSIEKVKNLRTCNK